MPFSLKPYFGTLPAPGVRPIVGSKLEWVEGLSYARYVAHGYAAPNGCATIVKVNEVVRIREVQSISVDVTYPIRGALSYQVQSVVARVIAPVRIDQVQDVPFRLGSRVLIEQVHDVQGVTTYPARLDQVQNLTAGLTTPIVVSQVQGVVDSSRITTPCSIYPVKRALVMNIVGTGTLAGFTTTTGSLFNNVLGYWNGGVTNIGHTLEFGFNCGMVTAGLWGMTINELSLPLPAVSWDALAFTGSPLLITFPVFVSPWSWAVGGTLTVTLTE